MRPNEPPARAWSVAVVAVLATLAALAVARAGSAQGLVTIAGTLSVPEQIALPRDVTVQIDLVAVSRDASRLGVIAAQRFRSNRQFPIPFALALDPSVLDPARRHAVRARVQDDRGRVLWATRELVAIDPVAGPRTVDLRLRRAGPLAASEPDEDVETRDEARAARELPDGDREAESGRAPGDAGPTIRNGRPGIVIERSEPAEPTEPMEPAERGAEPGDGDADVEVRSPGHPPVAPPARPAPPTGSEPHERVAEAPPPPPRDAWQDARQRGVAFRAVGHKPAWVVEIRRGQGGEKIELRGDVAGAPLVFENAEANVETNGRLTWRGGSGAHAIEVVVDAALCTDLATRERLEATVSVKLDGEALHGCGRALL
ncbi:MAG TPA: YbaY family lipoprotein [Candidatus Binatia bacterium]|nr:YbaY family lipoprotein [Candidatus Binatia bacterium]